MSDVGKLKRPGGSPFPSIRKSADPLQPEMGEIDFSQEVDEFDQLYSTAVQEAEKAEQNVITDENRRQQYRQRKRKHQDDEKTDKDDDDEEILVDLRV